MNHQITVSLVVSTYNWPEALLLSLLSIKRQQVLPNEVIIADDGSTDETRKLIESVQKDFPIPVIHVWHEDIGFRKTIIVNKAIKKAQGEYIILTDGDIIMHPYFIYDHISSAQPSYFIQGSRGLLMQKLSEQILQTKRTRIHPFEPGIKNRLNIVRLPVLSRLINADPYDSNRIIGCNIACWKDDYIAVNGYNNDLSGWGHEDIEFAARLINNNTLRKKIKFKAICYHIYHKYLSRDKEDVNMEVYRYTVKNKIKYCENGYHQV